MRLPLILAATLAVAACGIPSRRADRWTGPLTPTTPGPNCTPTRGMLQVTNGAVLFAPDEGTWLLNGTATPDGRIHADRSQPGTNAQAYETYLDGKWSADAVTGTYTTPRCTYTVQLSRR